MVLGAKLTGSKEKFCLMSTSKVVCRADLILTGFVLAHTWLMFGGHCSLLVSSNTAGSGSGFRLLLATSNTISAAGVITEELIVFQVMLSTLKTWKRLCNRADGFSPAECVRV